MLKDLINGVFWYLEKDIWYNKRPRGGVKLLPFSLLLAPFDKQCTSQLLLSIHVSFHILMYAPLFSLILHFFFDFDELSCFNFFLSLFYIDILYLIFGRRMSQIQMNNRFLWIVYLDWKHTRDGDDFYEIATHYGFFFVYHSH